MGEEKFMNEKSTFTTLINFWIFSPNNSLVERNELLQQSNGEKSLFLTEELLNEAEFVFSDSGVANEPTLLSFNDNKDSHGLVDENTCDLEIEKLFENISRETLQMDVDVVSPTRFVNVISPSPLVDGILPTRLKQVILSEC